MISPLGPGVTVMVDNRSPLFDPVDPLYVFADDAKSFQTSLGYLNDGGLATRWYRRWIR